MLKIANNVYVGTHEGLTFATPKNQWAIIHACQSYHYKTMGWSKNNKPIKSDPNYLIYQEKYEMSLNWVDGKSELFEWYTPTTISSILDFIDVAIGDSRKVYIHCDEGKSRSPTLALVYLAKRTSYLDKDVYKAIIEMKKIYPRYSPNGIIDYMASIWSKIN